MQKKVWKERNYQMLIVFFDQPFTFASKLKTDK